MNRTINELDALTELADGDELIAFDVSDSKSKKITKENFLKVIQKDTVIKKNVTITGTSDINADIQTLINTIINEGIGTYIGEFKRTGQTYGSYRLSYYVDGDGSQSVCGIVNTSLGHFTDAVYKVGFLLIAGSSTPSWNIVRIGDIMEDATITSSMFTVMPQFDAILDSAQYPFSAHLYRLSNNHYKIHINTMPLQCKASGQVIWRNSNSCSNIWHHIYPKFTFGSIWYSSSIFRMGRRI